MIHDAVVIGAGPAGLAVARELRRRGVDPVVLERDRVGASWAGYYPHLRLHSLRQLSGLPGRPLPGDAPRFPSGVQYLRYLERYAEAEALPVETGIEVWRVRWRGQIRSDGRWHLDTSAGPRTARAVVLATGIASTPHRPRFPGQDAFFGRVLHAAEYQGTRPFEDRRVLVVGAGNTAKDITTALIGEATAVGLVVRDGVLFRPYPSSVVQARLAAWALRTLPRALTEPVLRRVRRGYPELGLPLPGRPPLEQTPVIGLELVDAVRAGRLRVHPAIEGFAGREVRFAGGDRERYDDVILATGYRPTLDVLEDEVRLDARGRLHGPPRLAAVGFHYPTGEAFLQALPREARRVAAALAADLRRNG